MEHVEVRIDTTNREDAARALAYVARRVVAGDRAGDVIDGGGNIVGRFRVVDPDVWNSLN